jgi:hypothetical protein
MMFSDFRMFRVLRIARLVRISTSLNELFVNLLAALPSLSNIALLLGLILFVLSLLAMDLFGKVMFVPLFCFIDNQSLINTQRASIIQIRWQGHDHLQEHVNFSTFPLSLQTLLRIATVDDWAGVMYDCALKCPNVNKVMALTGWTDISSMSPLFHSVAISFIHQLIVNE